LSESNPPGGDILLHLSEVIARRKAERPERSYVMRLLDGGVPAIGAKVSEEAREAVEAASEEGTDHLVYEAADLLFHLWVLLGHRDVPPERVFAELERRFGTSGIEEKERRADTSTAEPTA
jgi:phosphoribosyl-ATP pyrophosphohydrolase